MPKSEEIVAQLKQHKVTLVGDIVEDISAEDKYYAFIYAKIDSRGRQKPSRSLLNKITNEYRKQGIEVVFIPISERSSDLQRILKTFMWCNYPSLVKDAYVVFDGNCADVWIEPKEMIDENQEVDVRNKVKEFLQFLNIRLRSLSNTLSGRTPSQTAVLKTVRLLVPVKHKELEQTLISKGFYVPDNDWLARMLDRLRKSNKIVRRRDGYYCLSLKALKILGTDKGRNSPDITRALDIARAFSDRIESLLGIPTGLQIGFKIHAGEGGQHVWAKRYRAIFANGWSMRLSGGRRAARRRRIMA